MRIAISSIGSARHIARRWRTGLGFLAGFAGASALLMAGAAVVPAAAQSSTATQAVMTIAGAEDFLKAAGLQTCEITEMDPLVTQMNRAVKAFSIGVAKSCDDYDPGDPTVINVHQFANAEDRDAMVSSLHNLRYRALKAYGSIWPVGNFVVVILGPKRAEIEASVRAEYQRRHPDRN